MNGRQRILAALDHTEPDWVPWDLGGTHVSTIAIRAYESLRDHLGLPKRKTEICDLLQQICVPHEDVIEKLGIDTGGLYPLCANNIPLPVGSEQWQQTHKKVDGGWQDVDEWGLTQFFPEKDGLYYSIVASPLNAAEVTIEQMDGLQLPAGSERWRVEGLRDKAEELHAEGRAVVVKSLCAGMVEMGERIRGMENFLVDMLAWPKVAERLLDRFLQIKMDFWTLALTELGDVVDVVLEMDDYGTQESQLVSPDTFRKMVKPKLKQLVDHIKRLAPGVKVMFHSCGAVRPIIGDFIEVGIDALNPVHITAEGMEPAGLKRDFGGDICFWGGGIETQHVLPSGTVQQVKDNVRRNAEALAPGGGWVFATVHNIQADVPPENIVAVAEALHEYGRSTGP